MKINRIEYWPYKLMPKFSLGHHAERDQQLSESHQQAHVLHPGFRPGALLKVTWENGVYGYGDLHSWEVFSDPPLAKQLQRLSAFGEGVPLFAKEIFNMAYDDGRARRLGESLLCATERIKNHILLTDMQQIDASSFYDIITFANEKGTNKNEVGSGCPVVKIKIGRHPVQEASILNHWVEEFSSLDFEFRLDFNLCFSETEFHSWLSLLTPGVLQRVEFFEDPIPYSPSVWKKLRGHWGIKLARDYIAHGERPQSDEIDVIVLKPIRNNLADYQEIIEKSNVFFVVTHYMDHSLGQMWALAQAQSLNKLIGARLLACGLLSKSIYCDDEFSNEIVEKDGCIVPPAGAGLGFGSKLAKLPWVDIGKEISI